MAGSQDLLSPTTAAYAACVVVAGWVFYQYAPSDTPWMVLLLADLALLLWTEHRDGGTDPWALHVAAGGFLLISVASLAVGSYFFTGVLALGVCTIAQGLDWRYQRRQTPVEPAEDVTRP